MAAPTSSPSERAAARGLLTHGLLDLLFAGLYAWLGFSVAPGRGTAWNLALGLVVALVAAAGLSLIARVRGARLIAIVAHLALLAFCAVVLVGLVGSAAYLRGVWGPVGKGMAIVSLLVSALVVELCGLLPLFQLRFLLRPDVRAMLGGRPDPPDLG